MRPFARRSWCDRHPSSCKHTHRHHNDCNKTLRDNYKQFYDLSKDIVKIDKKLQRSCDSNNTREIISPDAYILYVKLPDFELGHISVQIRHRLLHIQAYKPGEDSKLFSELKILPTFLELADAAYKFADGVLEVVVPIKLSKDETENVCRRRFNESVVTIPNMDTKKVEDNLVDDTSNTPVVNESTLRK
ncbi:hypothetical protein ACJJTC_007170 [Scirpophaga incertulas]